MQIAPVLKCCTLINIGCILRVMKSHIIIKVNIILNCYEKIVQMLNKLVAENVCLGDILYKFQLSPVVITQIVHASPYMYCSNTCNRKDA
jgi:hypothetical protein